MNEQKATINTKVLASQLRIDVTDVHINVAQEVIITTEDKLRLCLLEYLEYMGKKRAWVTPLGILLTVLVTFVTTTFKDIGFSAYTWQAIFTMTGILSLIWLLWSVYQATKTKKVEDIVKELKLRKVG